VIPVDVTARDLDTHHTISEDSQVADETNVGDPLGSSMLSMIAPLAVGESTLDVFNGAPAQQSGRMCLTVHLREGHTRLGFCNRYTGTGAGGLGITLPALLEGVLSDTSTALSLIDQVQFAALHVTKVTARVAARRGLDTAAILGAQMPRVVTAGSRVKVRLRVQLYRSKVRTVSFELRIPRGLSGPQVATLRQGSGGGVDALLEALFGFSPGGGGGPRQPPRSLAALKKAFAAVPSYDGLSVTFGKHDTERVFRDPKFVITGQTTLAFDVRGGHGKHARPHGTPKVKGGSRTASRTSVAS
jgi:hypothetical protein